MFDGKDIFMRILVISDTHGKLDRFWEVFNKLRIEDPVQMIVHCGDYLQDAKDIRMRAGIPVISVGGNCDGNFDDAGYSILETEAGDFMVTHGHMQNVNFNLQKLYYRAQEAGCIGALFGHTHRSCYVDHDGIYLMNPGSLSEPRDGSGGTFGILDTHETGVWGKIYRYEDFMGIKCSGGGNSGNSGTSKPKPKVTGGKLRSLLNYSDRF